MMSKRLLVLAAALLVMPALAQAENSTCANADPLIPGQLKTDVITDTQPDQWYKTTMAPGRSYAVMAWAPNLDESEMLSVDPTISVFKSDCVGAFIGDVEASTQEGTIAVSQWVAAHNQFTPNPTDCLTADGCEYRIQVTDGLATGNSYTLHVLLVETTIHIPYWQVVTAASYDAAPQIRNGNGGDSARFYVRIYDQNGVNFCNMSFGMFGSGASVPANGMATFSIASSCAISSGFGSAAVATSLQPGYTSANITTFSGASGLSFDAPGYPRMYWTGAN